MNMNYALPRKKFFPYNPSYYAFFFFCKSVILKEKYAAFIVKYYFGTDILKCLRYLNY
jgi:hypothetical protein